MKNASPICEKSSNRAIGFEDMKEVNRACMRDPGSAGSGEPRVLQNK